MNGSRFLFISRQNNMADELDLFTLRGSDKHCHFAGDVSVKSSLTCMFLCDINPFLTICGK